MPVWKFSLVFKIALSQRHITGLALSTTTVLYHHWVRHRDYFLKPYSWYTFPNAHFLISYSRASQQCCAVPHSTGKVYFFFCTVNYIVMVHCLVLSFQNVCYVCFLFFFFRLRVSFCVFEVGIYSWHALWCKAFVRGLCLRLGQVAAVSAALVCNM